METLETLVKKCEKDIDILYARTNDSAVAQARICAQLDNVLVTLGKLEQAVGQIQSKPAQRWEALVAQIVSVLAAALVGGLAGKLL